MKSRNCAVLGALFCLFCTDALALNYKYNSSVTLEGTLVLPTADPEFTFCDKQHQFPAIKLLEAISVVCEPEDSGCLPEAGINLMHLVLEQPQMVKFRKLKGRKAKVRGILLHAESGHDFTSVLMDVDSIDPLKH